MNLLNYIPVIDAIIYKQFEVGVLRLDKIHADVSGNKWFKLKYNLQQARIENKNCIITFGGAFSNHIVATAVACKINGFKSIGIIRGEETSALNSTLTLAKQHGMALQFVSREMYQQKDNVDYLEGLQKQYQQAYIIPEGGDNDLGAKGCTEILTEITSTYQSVFCAFGTGTTFKGLSQSLQKHQQLTAIHVLKYEAKTSLTQCEINNNYHFGGYAKHSAELLEFKIWFENEYDIPLDYVYTAKLFFAVFDLINQSKISSNQKLLIIHSGGLQGNKGYEERYNLL